MNLDLTTCSRIEGRLGAIFCWYSDEWWEFKWSEITSLIRLIPQIVKGNFERLDAEQLFMAMDALGSFAPKDPELWQLYLKVREAWRVKSQTALKRINELEWVYNRVQPFLGPPGVN